jgi:hypothetical protein
MTSGMVHDVIDAGYRAMAKKLHPDVGGDHDAMLALGEACEILRRYLPNRTKRVSRS